VVVVELEAPDFLNFENPPGWGVVVELGIRESLQSEIAMFF